MQPAFGRRAVLGLTSALCLGLAAGAPDPARAQTGGAAGWPGRPVVIVVNGGPGSLPDLFARPIAERLRTAFGQPFVVENKPGGGGMVAMQQVKANPDGHTLALVTNAHLVWNPFVFPKLSYDPAADLLPVSPIAVIPMALTTTPSLPAASLAELQALARREPGRYNYASSGNGSPPHVIFEVLRDRLGANLVHVPYKTGPEALTATMAGDTQLYLAGTALVEPMVRDGRLKVIAISDPVPTPPFDRTPSFADAGFAGFDGAVWLGFATGNQTPKAVIERLNAEIGKALKDPAMEKVYASHGSIAYHTDAAAFDARVRRERETWGPAIQRLGIKPQ